MSWLDRLTRPGLVDNKGNTRYFNSLDDVANAEGTALQNATTQGPGLTNMNAPPTNVQVGQPDTTVPLPSGTAGPQELGPPTLSYSQAPPTVVPPIDPSAAQGLPREFKPSFEQASTDAAGNVRPINPSLSKLGVLALLLKSGISGVSDALASGALNAQQGKSGFGSGVQGAVEMPIFRAQRAADLAKEAAATQAAQAQTAHTTAETANLPAQTAYLNAHANYMNSMAGNKDQRTAQQMYDAAWMDAQGRGVDPTTDPKVKQALIMLQNYEKSLPQRKSDQATQVAERQQIADQLGLDGDQRTYYILNGKSREGNPDLDARMAEMEANRGLRASEHADSEADRAATRDATAESRFQTQLGQYNNRKNEVMQRQRQEYDKLEADFSRKFAVAPNKAAQDALTQQHETKKAQLDADYRRQYQQLGPEQQMSAPRSPVPALNVGKGKKNNDPLGIL